MAALSFAICQAAADERSGWWQDGALLSAQQVSTMALDRRTALSLAGIGAGLALVGAAVLVQKLSHEGGLDAPLPLPKTAPPIESVTERFPELKKIVDDPKVGSVLKEFVVAYNDGGVEGAKSFAKLRGFMNENDDVTLSILTETDETEALEAELVKEKAQIVGRGDQRIDVLIPWDVVVEQARSGRPPEQLIEALSKLTNVRGVLPMDKPSVHQQKTGVKLKGPSEGVKVTRADLWHKAGYRGAGVKVGVLDPEVSKAAQFLGSALPASTQVFMGSCVNRAGASVDAEGLHGVAAAEIVHEMAPDAQIYLACSLGDEAAAINWLMAQGVKIISYSAGGMYGPRNGTGSSQSRIDKLTKSGLLWVNAAGNDGKVFHRGTLTGGQNGYWHAFAPGRTAMGFKTQIETNIRVSLIWSEWNSAIISDYNLYIFDSKMNEIARSEDKNTFLRQPSEQISIQLRPNSTYYVGVRGASPTKPAPFVLNVHGASSIDYLVPAGSLAPPADAVGALAVGAVVWNTDKLATYSSRGPTEDGRIKPDLSAPTQVTNGVYGESFAGTSSACPHVAGAAAVLWGRFPSASRDEIVSLLTSRARDLGAKGPDNDYGAGRLDLGDPSTLGSAPVAALAPSVTATSPIKTTPTATAVATASPTTTSPAPSSPGDDEDGDETVSNVAKGLLIVVGLGAAGSVGVVVGLVSLVTSLLRGRSKPPPVQMYGHPPAPLYHQHPPVHPAAPSAAPAPLVTPPLAPRPLPVAKGDSPWNSPDYVAALVCVSGPIAGKSVALKHDQTLTVGRAQDSDLSIPASNVSHWHAWVRATPQGCFVTDRGSSNGTFVNGQRVLQARLNPGDMITMGAATFRFEINPRARLS